MKEHYSLLLKEYGRIFGKAITEQHRKHFGHILVHPSQLTLFEDDGQKKWREQNMLRGGSDQLVQKILNESNLISGEMIKLWHHYIDLLKISPRFTTAYYEINTLQKMQIFWNNYFSKQLQVTKDICLASEESHKNTEQRSYNLLKGRDKTEINWEVVGEEWGDRSSFPVLVQNYYSYLKKSVESKYEDSEKEDNSLHLVVLVSVGYF